MTPTTTSNLRVLSVGSDNTLLCIREFILKQIGYSVSSAYASELAPNDIDYDIVVLCRSIMMEVAEALARTVKTEHPKTRIVLLSSSAAVHDEYFDAVCDPTYGPTELLAELARLRQMH